MKSRVGRVGPELWPGPSEARETSVARRTSYIQPPMPPTTTAPDASTGLFSSVFSFVSREVKSFVNSAAGKSAEEVRYF